MTFSRGLFAIALVLTMASASACKSKPSAAALQAFPAQEAARVADAIFADDGVTITALIHDGANASATGESGKSLLQFAVWKDKPKAFKALLAAGADTAHADDDGDTVMHSAATADDYSFMNALLAKKVDPNVINEITGDSPLMDAAVSGNGSQLHGLLQAEAKLDVAEPNGDNALIMASQTNKFQAVLDLLAAGADPLARNKTGATFQRYLSMTPANVTAPETQRERDKIQRWLVGHNVPIES
ncbi:MAG: ankyrin repeat domain-containing protein [Polyangiaceae bacterium]